MKLNIRKKPLVLDKFDALIPRLFPNFLKMEELKHAQTKSKRGYIGSKRSTILLTF